MLHFSHMVAARVHDPLLRLFRTARVNLTVDCFDTTREFLLPEAFDYYIAAGRRLLRDAVEAASKVDPVLNQVISRPRNLFWRVRSRTV